MNSYIIMLFLYENFFRYLMMKFNYCDIDEKKSNKYQIYVYTTHISHLFDLQCVIRGGGGDIYSL